MASGLSQGLSQGLGAPSLDDWSQGARATNLDLLGNLDDEEDELLHDEEDDAQEESDGYPPHFALYLMSQ